MIMMHSVSHALPIEDLRDWSECMLSWVYVETFLSVVSVVPVSHLGLDLFHKSRMMKKFKIFFVEWWELVFHFIQLWLIKALRCLKNSET